MHYKGLWKLKTPNYVHWSETLSENKHVQLKENKTTKNVGEKDLK